MESETPNQIIGVLAHETGHIAGGHLAKMREQMAAARRNRSSPCILGVGAMVAGAQAAAVGLGQAGWRRSSPARRSIQNLAVLLYLRAQEDQADTAAVKFLTATGQSAKGMYETFKRFADQILFTRATSIPTCSRTRCRASAWPRWKDGTDEPLLGQEGPAGAAGPPRPDARQALRLHRAAGRGGAPLSARATPASPARYARAISAYRFSDPRAALAQIDALIQRSRNNPYFHELKGQALLEGGKPAPRRSRRCARRCSSRPTPTLIQIMLGQALVATNDKRAADEA